ncbi:hypothetical protein G7Z17_g8129 [Cylindrodendrum hubeiense]|uniref:Uncharacterized protein n=1 Tax=Cylindrodendrum hubeiense TaxID=595255 RepID=A0A9P5LDH4_9HYPO|nr:hypothetical protein G7Z17_g8129 [Cylindrodendrum hubeiense]
MSSWRANQSATAVRSLGEAAIAPGEPAGTIATGYRRLAGYYRRPALVACNKSVHTTLQAHAVRDCAARDQRPHHPCQCPSFICDNPPWLHSSRSLVHDIDKLPDPPAPALAARLSRNLGIFVIQSVGQSNPPFDRPTATHAATNVAAMDQTTLSTLDLLESRLMRVEHLLYGQTVSPSLAQDYSAVEKIGDLEKRFSILTSKIRVYGELLRIYKSHPDFFHTADPSDPPSQLSIDAVQSIVLASASSFPSTLSSLTAIKDSPIPDPAESTTLIVLGDRMKAIEATQVAQVAEMADLRRRSERIIRSWYESGVLNNSSVMADLESRVELAERQVRRAERELDEEDDL